MSTADLVVAIGLSDRPWIVCNVHGAGGLLTAHPQNLHGLQLAAAEPRDRLRVPRTIYLAHHARGCIPTTIDLRGARIRDASADERESFDRRCFAHRSTVDFQRGYGGLLALDEAVLMATALDRYRIPAYGRRELVQRYHKRVSDRAVRDGLVLCAADPDRVVEQREWDELAHRGMVVFALDPYSRDGELLTSEAELMNIMATRAVKRSA